jgi:hypothetical protein
VVVACAQGVGLYWVAAQAGWLAAGWGPALATTLLYLAAVVVVERGLSWLIGGLEARALRSIERESPGGG